MATHYLWSDDLPSASTTGSSSAGTRAQWWAVLEFEQPIIAPLGSLVIASRLDADIRIHLNDNFLLHSTHTHTHKYMFLTVLSLDTNNCRLAFHGKLVASLDSLQQLKIYKKKQRHAYSSLLPPPPPVHSRSCSLLFVFG